MPVGRGLVRETVLDMATCNIWDMFGGLIALLITRPTAYGPSRSAVIRVTRPGAAILGTWSLARIWTICETETSEDGV